jgi:hypothetical protein
MKITKRQLKRIIKEERAKLLKEARGWGNETEITDDDIVRANQGFETLSPGSDEYDEAYDALFDELRNTFSGALDKGLISDDINDAIADALNYIGEGHQVEGRLRENRSPLGTDEEIADKLIKRGKFTFKQRAAVVAGLKKLDSSYKQKMSDVSSNVEVGY